MLGRMALVALVFLGIGGLIEGQSIEFESDLDGTGHDFSYIENGLIYLTDQSMIVKNIESRKIVF